MKRIAFWGLFGATLSIYGTMLGWSLPTVSAAAGGLTPFDMRPGGYSFAEAQAFLSALSAEGARFYVDVQQKLDIIYPPMMSLSLFFAVAFLAPAWLRGWRWVLASFALPTAVFDALENHAVAGMIAAGPTGLTPEIVTEASQWTVLKSTSTMVVMSLLLVLLAIKSVVALRRVSWTKVKAFTAKRPVGAFLVLAFAASWAVQFAGARAGLSMFALSSAGVIVGLALPALAVTAIAGGKAGLRDLLSRWLRWKVPVAWYLGAGLGLLAAMVVVASPIEGFAPLRALLENAPRLVTEFLPEMLLGLVFIQIFEELAWTGFLQQRLQEQHGALKAALMVAPAFGLSHLMINYLEAGALLPALAMASIQVVFGLFFRVLVAWFYNGAGQSVLIAALFHVAFNVANGQFTSDLVGEMSASWLPLALVAVGAVGIGVVTKGRLGLQQAGQNPKPMQAVLLAA